MFCLNNKIQFSLANAKNSASFKRKKWLKITGFAHSQTTNKLVNEAADDSARVRRPVLNVVLLPCRTQLIELNSTLARRCRVARQALPCYTAVARLDFKRRGTAVPNSIHELL